MKTLKLYSLLAFSLFILLSSCEKEDKNAVNEAREALNQATDELVGYINEFKESEAIGSMSMSGDMPLPFGVEEKAGLKASQKVKHHALNIFRPIIRKAGLRTKSDDYDHFVFADHTGTYSWNFTKQDWDYEPNVPSDKIIVHFPANKGDESNTATLTLNSISFFDYSYSDEFGTYTSSSLTGIDMNLYINGEKQIDLFLDNKVDADGFPVHTDFSLFFNPYQIDAEITSTSTAYAYNYTVVKGSETMFSGELSYEGDFDENIGTIKGFQQAASLNVKFDVNLKDILDEANEQENEDRFIVSINKYADVAFYTYPENVKIGDIELGIGSDESLEVYIMLTDGSKENAMPYFEKILDAIENLADELENRYAFDYYAKK